MKKLGCAKCGGMKKMKAGGTNNVNISKPGAGYAKRTVGGDNPKMNMYGIAQTGQGQMDGKTGVMKNGGIKKPLIKAQAGRTTGKPTADSTAYYKENIKIINKDIKGEPNTRQGKQNKYGKFGLVEAKLKAYGDLNRQKFKGKPGYDKNGFPIKKK